MIVRSGIVEGFYSQPVAGTEEPAPRSIPDGKGEHSIEVRQEISAPLEIALEQNLGVSPGIEEPTPGLKLVTKLTVVVDLAIEDNPGAARAGGHGLKPALGKIQNGEPPVSQPHPGRRSRASLSGVAQKGGAEAIGFRPAYQEPFTVGSS